MGGELKCRVASGNVYTQFHDNPITGLKFLWRDRHTYWYVDHLKLEFPYKEAGEELHVVAATLELWITDVLLDATFVIFWGAQTSPPPPRYWKIPSLGTGVFVP
jgi:hypothetical protein